MADQTDQQADGDGLSTERVLELGAIIEAELDRLGIETVQQRTTRQRAEGRNAERREAERRQSAQEK